MRIRLLLVHDSPPMRERLRTLLEEQTGWEVVAEAGNGPEAVRLAEVQRPDVAVVDVETPLPNGLETTRRLLERSPATKVIIFSMYSEEAYVTQSRKAGAAGFVLADSADVDLPAAVNDVSQGKSFLSPTLAGSGSGGITRT